MFSNAASRTAKLLLSASFIFTSSPLFATTIIWNSVEGATHYKVQIKPTDGVWSDVSAQPIVATEQLLSGYQAGNYLVRVSGCVEEPGVEFHCAPEAAVFSDEVSVDLDDSSPAKSQRVIFIHTDLLGTPITESSSTGSGN